MDADWPLIGVRFALYATLSGLFGLSAFSLYGLKAGERVIIDGVQKITAGVKVKPVDQTPLHGEAGPKHDADEAPDAPGDKAEAAPRAAAVNRH